MRHLFSLGVVLAVTTGCGGDTGSGQGPSGAHTGGASGAGATTSSSGGAANSGGTGNAGAQGLGGAGGMSGALKWYPTCGPPVCRAPTPGAGGTSSGISACTATETAGSVCSTADAECDNGAACSGPLKCAASDPTHGGQCPISRAKYKQDIEYLTAAERAKLADDVQSIPLVRYRYKDGPERQHLGFIIEDIEPSPSVDSQHDQVDLYGYTSMAIAALQEQRREIDSLKAEIRELRGSLANRKGASSK